MRMSFLLPAGENAGDGRWYPHGKAHRVVPAPLCSTCPLYRMPAISDLMADGLHLDLQDAVRQLVM
jgi:hypothetical protein